MNQENKRFEVLFIIFFIILIVGIILFNFTVDPYYIFRDSTIKGFNNVKTHKYTNKRTIVYSDMKINHKNKDIAFTGNCLLSHYGSGLDEVAFFTIPVAKVYEVANIIKSIHKVAPNIKTIYWGLFFDDFWNDKNDEVSDTLPDFNDVKINTNDLINLFFSYNTTKYSIETVKDSVKNKGEDILYVYPYREIAKKEYNKQFNFDALNIISEVKKFAEDNGIKLIIYYSPIHVSKKVHIYEKGLWETNQELKKRLAKITSFYDYSFFNEYNASALDENNFNFIDNIHPSNKYNNLVVYDLLSDNKKIGVFVNSENVDNLLKEDTISLHKYIQNNKALCDKIKNVTKNQANERIRRKNVI